MARHREFDCEKALEAAMHLFWEKGYEGTSYADLSEATGVARPGLYAAFGDKQSLFLKALERYGEKETCFFTKALALPDIRDVIETLIKESAKVNTQPDKPQGCLGINGALACSEKSLPVQEALTASREEALAALTKRLMQAKDDNAISPSIDAATLARFIVTFQQGVAVQAKAGTSKEKIDNLIEMTLEMLRRQLDTP